MMLKNILLTILLFATTVLVGQTNVDGFLRQQGTSIVNNQGNFVIRGMGPGGWMLQEGYMFQTKVGTQHEIKEMLTDLTDQETMEAFYDAWLEHFFTREDVALVAESKYNSIRVPLHYDLFTLPSEEEADDETITWLTKGFEMTDALLQWCKENDLYLILDLHAAPGGQGKNADISDYDSSKPSLWELEQNKTKMVELWRKLAERYANETHIGGYDLLNETNWDFENSGNENGCNCSNNQPIYDLYTRCIEAIRSVDQNHIIIIEGNCWANNFSGLEDLVTIDENLSFSFHKYWTVNEDWVVQGLLDMRDRIQVPLFLGETGENSNTWMTEMIQQAERLNIGWSTWAYKQIDIDDFFSIDCPEWSAISNYEPWSNNNRPSEAEARQAMDAMIESIKLENCQLNEGVVLAQTTLPFDATFSKPYADHYIPGTIYGTDYDHGAYNSTWKDTGYENLHVSTNNYTAWNEGYLYRNDGVDIESCSDSETNGYNVGWTDNGEWLDYTLQDLQPGTYNITFRVASESIGSINIKLDDKFVSSTHIEVPNTGGYQNWWNVRLRDVEITERAEKLRIYIVQGGFNFNYIDFDLITTNAPMLETKGLSCKIKRAANQTVLELNNNSSETIEVKQINLLGMNGKVYGQYSGFTLVQQETVDLQQLVPGVYCVRVVTDERVYTVKFTR